ncbi:saccharopine dehydrogenase NADP binding domain-containing protein [Phthorimaea operculella]|nr:saccharopine dehydrogenase NADP binding domain-containing protein [Phthorimaea operculella]
MDLRFDIIVLGATGFAGKHAVKNLALLCKQTEYADIRWGIAGRSMEKLKNLLSELEEIDVDIKRVVVLHCDITKTDAVPEVTCQARIIINATGPNIILSGPVVKACIQTGTHYVDISAELHHMLNIYRSYNKAAQDANVLVIPACGYDCIPALGGLIYLEKQFQGTLHFVECYTVLEIPKRAYFPGCNNCLLHYGTWESMIHEMQSFRRYRELKKQTFPEIEPVPEQLKRRFFHRHNGRFWCPYPGPDHDVVEMYQNYKKQTGGQPYFFKSFTTMPLFIHFFIIVPVFFVFYFMCYFACLRNLLWKYPRFFTLGFVSRKGPNEEMRKGLRYSFTLTGRGWSKGADLKSTLDKSVTVKVSGSDPAYRTTGMALVLSAITILKEKSAMPSGGVLTTGAAFRDTQLIERLHKNGMNFETVENTSLINGPPRG